MSQFFVNSSGGTPPPQVPTEFDTQNGNSTTSNSIEIINGFDGTSQLSAPFNKNLFSLFKGDAIQTFGGTVNTGTQNEIDIRLVNQFHATATTSGLVSSTAITLPLSSGTGTIFISLSVLAFDPGTPSSAGFQSYTTFRVNGGTPVIVGDTDTIVHSDPALITANFSLTPSGNNIVLSVIGVAGLTIRWFASGVYYIVQ